MEGIAGASAVAVGMIREKCRYDIGNVAFSGGLIVYTCFYIHVLIRCDCHLSTSLDIIPSFCGRNTLMQNYLA